LIVNLAGHSEACGAFLLREFRLSVRFTASPCPPSRLAACLRRLGQQRACVVYPASGMPSSPWSAARLLRLLRLRTGGRTPFPPAGTLLLGTPVALATTVAAAACDATAFRRAGVAQRGATAQIGRAHV